MEGMTCFAVPVARTNPVCQFNLRAYEMLECTAAVVSPSGKGSKLFECMMNLTSSDICEGVIVVVPGGRAGTVDQLCPFGVLTVNLRLQELMHQKLRYCQSVLLPILQTPLHHVDGAGGYPDRPIWRRLRESRLWDSMRGIIDNV